ncbi:hypothetical protein [Lentibacillus cibarius]|uniref:Uncharacterized protein n=1 Tax=Lentibacillus cibarius TaxID=2583219 RepID=A0A5S3QND6_9BACI|nr:hypothetical protein [Lentibacillus cibarius]TMN22006.1 hypothetical protein FFL34_07655 [Lentibacillus cibarius]
MPLEQEVPNLLIIGFVFIVLVFSISTIALWVKNKRNSIAYLLILVHLILLSIAFVFFMNAVTLQLDYNHPMASEENSLQIGFAGVFWALSIITLLVAIFKFSSSSKRG